MAGANTKMNKDFFRKYDMQVFPSQRKLRRIPKMWNHVNMWNVSVSDAMTYQSLEVEEVDCVDVTMPKDKLQELEDMIAWYEEREHRIKHNEDVVEMLRRDERVRIENPAVQKAYSKYLTLLELCRK